MAAMTVVNGRRERVKQEGHNWLGTIHTLSSMPSSTIMDVDDDASFPDHFNDNVAQPLPTTTSSDSLRSLKAMTQGVQPPITLPPTSSISDESNSEVMSPPSSISLDGDDPSFMSEDEDDNRSPSEHNSEEATISSEYNNEVGQSIINVKKFYSLKHESAVSAVAFSRDGKYLAIGCYNEAVYIYDVKTGKKTDVLQVAANERKQASSESITAVCFSPGGEYLATASSGYDIRIWEISRRRVRCILKGYGDSFSFSHNGRLGCSRMSDTNVIISSMRDGSSKTLFNGNFRARSLTAGFSPDGRYVVAVVETKLDFSGLWVENDVMIWNARTHRLFRILKLHTSFIHKVIFTPDREGLVSFGGKDEGFKYWDLGSISRKRGTIFPVESSGAVGIWKVLNGVQYILNSQQWAWDLSAFGYVVTSYYRWVTLWNY